MHPSFDALQGIILAAGKSSRFGTGRTKVLEPINGQAMLMYSVNLMNELGIKSSVVIGYQADKIQTFMHDYNLTYSLQPEQRGTAHALLCSQAQWNKEHILVLNADMPLLDADLIKRLYACHIQQNAVLSFVVAHNTTNSTDYGRLMEHKGVQRIVEASDFTESIDNYPLINAGVYIINHTFLSTAITHISDTNSAKEFYITDLIQQASILKRLLYIQAPFEHVQGVNTFEQLYRVEKLHKENLIKKHMTNGVRFDDPSTVMVHAAAIITPGAHIGVGVHLLGKCFIGADAFIGPYSIITDSHIKNNVQCNAHCVISKSTIEQNAKLGPFCFIEGNSSVGADSVVGSFVHINRSKLGTGVKAKHLAYLADAQLGNNVNIGAGVITANYDGSAKHCTLIADNVFVGSSTTLIAPVTLEHSSYTAAGSTITMNVETESLAIARATQINKIGYATKLKTKKEALKIVSIKKYTSEQSL